MPLVHIENARTEEQLGVMQQIVDDGVCPFCPEHLAKYHKNPILETGEYWVITKNQWPYKGTKNHLLAIARTHVEKLDDLPAAAGAELFTLFQKVSKDLGITGGTMAMRMGNDDKYASSVRHLHVHLIEPDFESPEHEGINFRVSKKKE